MSETYYAASFQISFSLGFLKQPPMMEFTALISIILLISSPMDELGIGSATQLLLIENSDELEGTQEEQNFFRCVRKFYSERVRKMIAFTDLTVSDLSILNPRHRFHVTATSSLTRLLKRFNTNSNCDVDAVVMEFREYRSLADSQLPACNDSGPPWGIFRSLPERLLLIKCFYNLAVVLPHSTANPERLFSMIGKVDTSQHSNLHALTVCDILCVKNNTDLECYKSKELFTPNLPYQAKTATMRCLSDE